MELLICWYDLLLKGKPISANQKDADRRGQRDADYSGFLQPRNNPGLDKRCSQSFRCKPKGRVLPVFRAHVPNNMIGC